jgi:hypothetical protein
LTNAKFEIQKKYNADADCPPDGEGKTHPGAAFPQGRDEKGPFVRRLILERPFETAADVLADLDRHLGDGRLRIRR